MQSSNDCGVPIWSLKLKTKGPELVLVVNIVLRLQYSTCVGTYRAGHLCDGPCFRNLWRIATDQICDRELQGRRMSVLAYLSPG